MVSWWESLLLSSRVTSPNASTSSVSFISEVAALSPAVSSVSAVSGWDVKDSSWPNRPPFSCMLATSILTLALFLPWDGIIISKLNSKWLSVLRLAKACWYLAWNSVRTEIKLACFLSSSSRCASARCTFSTKSPIFLPLSGRLKINLLKKKIIQIPFNHIYLHNAT